MLKRSVLQATWNGEHKAPQVFLDSLTKSDEQSRMIDGAGVGSGARYSISASTGNYVEHSCLVSSADPVQQSPCAPPVQAGQILDRSTLSETNCSGYLSSHSSENSASTTLSTSSSLASSSESPNLRRAVTVKGDLLQQSANCG